VHVESSPPSASRRIPAPEEHEKHDNDHNGLINSSNECRQIGARPKHGWCGRLSCYHRPFFRGIVVPSVLGRIVGAIAVRGAIGARMTGIVAAGGIVVAIAVGWIFCVPGAPA